MIIPHIVVRLIGGHLQGDFPEGIRRGISKRAFARGFRGDI